MGPISSYYESGTEICFAFTFLATHSLLKDREREMESKEAKPQVKKGLWRPEEDLILKTYVETHGEGNWSTVSKKSGLMRGGKSCRLRWKNYLRPNIKRGGMSQDEEDMIIRMHKLLGNRWSLIAGRLPGRTDNEVKNYWNTHLNKRCPSRKRTTMDSDPDGNQNNSKKASRSKRIRALNNSQPTEELEGKSQEKEEISAVSDAWIQHDAQSMNYYIESPMVPDISAAFVFDDEPFLAYWDSFVSFESLGCVNDW
ncbi:unnamed protein product [Dovyalis caffra]|uniref:Myb-related protein 123 n=1 Tax=Dovyalis caffra TaxID=77055 RepID=A0AAV1S2B0_9ROSI|nr:unnamed protein product [Dovyalis caffra]